MTTPNSHWTSLDHLSTLSSITSNPWRSSNWCQRHQLNQSTNPFSLPTQFGPNKPQQPLQTTAHNTALLTTSLSITTMDSHNKSNQSRCSSHKSLNCTPHKLSFQQPKLLSTTLLDLAVPPAITRLRSQSHSLTREVTSSSQREDGSAANARTITSREERSVIDAKKQSLMKTLMVCQLTCKLQRILPSQQPSKRLLSNAHQRPVPRKAKRDLVTGLAKDAQTIISRSEILATCATWAISKVTSFSTDNNKINMILINNPIINSCINHNIAKTMLSASLHQCKWMPMLLLGHPRHLCQVTTSDL